MLLGLSLTSAVCKPLLVIQRDREQHYISIECPLAEDKRIVLSGFEWGSIAATVPEDDRLPQSWYEALMNH